MSLGFNWDSAIFLSKVRFDGFLHHIAIGRICGKGDCWFVNVQPFKHKVCKQNIFRARTVMGIKVDLASLSIACIKRTGAAMPKNEVGKIHNFPMKDLGDIIN